MTKYEKALMRLRERGYTEGASPLGAMSKRIQDNEELGEVMRDMIAYLVLLERR